MSAVTPDHILSYPARAHPAILRLSSISSLPPSSLSTLVRTPPSAHSHPCLSGVPYLPPLCPVIRVVGQNLSFSDRGSSWGSSSQDHMALGSFAQPTLGPDSPSVESPSMPRRGPSVEAGEMSPTPQAASLTPQGGAGWAARKRSEDITRVPASYQSRMVRLCVGV